jgi:sugar lactone lactonase YvrE
MKLLHGTLLVISIARPAMGQAALGAAVQSVRTAMGRADHQGAARVADSLWRVFPGHPSLVMLRAQAMAAAGRFDDAERDVRRLLAWDARYARRALQDSLLAPLRARLDSVVSPLMARADAPISRGSVWATIEERDFVPEGTAWDPATGSILVGSLNKQAIVAIASDGRVSERVARGANALGSVVGLHVDARRGILWAASNPRFDRTDDTTSSALFAFEAASGRFRQRNVVPSSSGGSSFLNDLTTSSDGTVFVTDSRAAKIWMLRAGATSLEVFNGAGEITAPNGITISDDGRHLFVSDIDHIKVVPLSGAAPWKLEVPDSVNVTGIDGLAFAQNGLIAHHPLNYWRVARYELDPGHRRVTGRTVIEMNTEDSRTSTTGEVVGNEYVYIGNSQIDRMNNRTIDAATMQPIRMYRAPVRPPPQ